MRRVLSIFVLVILIGNVFVGMIGNKVRGDTGVDLEILDCSYDLFPDKVKFTATIRNNGPYDIPSGGVFKVVFFVDGSLVSSIKPYQGLNAGETMRVFAYYNDPSNGIHSLHISLRDRYGNPWEDDNNNNNDFYGSFNVGGHLSPPSNLIASLGNGYINLQWESPDGEISVDGYKIYKGTSSGGEVYLTTTTETFYRDYDVAVGNKYYYYVRAFNETYGIDSEPSNEVSIIYESDSLDGLVAYYDFNEGNGDIIHDKSGNGNDGTIYGATWVDGIEGKALYFDGVDDYVEINSVNSFEEINGQFTINAWVYLQSYPSSTEINNARTIFMISTFTPTGGGEENILVVCASSFYNDNKVRVVVKDDGGDNKIKDFDYSIALDKWSMLTVVANEVGEISLYIDGMLIGTHQWSPPLNVNNIFGEYIGVDIDSDGSLTDFFHGVIDEIRIYNRALTEEEIQQYYNEVMGEQNNDIHQIIGGNLDQKAPGIVKINGEYYMAYIDGESNYPTNITLVKSDNIYFDNIIMKTTVDSEGKKGNMHTTGIIYCQNKLFVAYGDTPGSFSTKYKISTDFGSSFSPEKTLEPPLSGNPQFYVANGKLYCMTHQWHHISIRLWNELEQKWDQIGEINPSHDLFPTGGIVSTSNGYYLLATSSHDGWRGYLYIYNSSNGVSWNEVEQLNYRSRLYIGGDSDIEYYEGYFYLAIVNKTTDDHSSIEIHKSNDLENWRLIEIVDMGENSMTQDPCFLVDEGNLYLFFSSNKNGDYDIYMKKVEKGNLIKGNLYTSKNYISVSSSQVSVKIYSTFNDAKNVKVLFTDIDLSTGKYAQYTKSIEVYPNSFGIAKFNVNIKGHHKLIFDIDSDNEIEETNENDNHIEKIINSYANKIILTKVNVNGKNYGIVIEGDTENLIKAQKKYNDKDPDFVNYINSSYIIGLPTNSIIKDPKLASEILYKAVEKFESESHGIPPTTASLYTETESKLSQIGYTELISLSSWIDKLLSSGKEYEDSFINAFIAAAEHKSPEKSLAQYIIGGSLAVISAVESGVETREDFKDFIKGMNVRISEKRVEILTPSSRPHFYLGKLGWEEDSLSKILGSSNINDLIDCLCEYGKEINSNEFSYENYLLSLKPVKAANKLAATSYIIKIVYGENSKEYQYIKTAYETLTAINDNWLEILYILFDVFVKTPMEIIFKMGIEKFIREIVIKEYIKPMVISALTKLVGKGAAALVGYVGAFLTGFDIGLLLSNKDEMKKDFILCNFILEYTHTILYPAIEIASNADFNNDILSAARAFAMDLEGYGNYLRAVSLTDYAYGIGGILHQSDISELKKAAMSCWNLESFLLSQRMKVFIELAKKTKYVDGAILVPEDKDVEPIYKKEIYIGRISIIPLLNEFDVKANVLYTSKALLFDLFENQLEEVIGVRHKGIYHYTTEPSNISLKIYNKDWQLVGEVSRSTDGWIYPNWDNDRYYCDPILIYVRDTPEHIKVTYKRGGNFFGFNIPFTAEKTIDLGTEIEEKRYKVAKTALGKINAVYYKQSERWRNKSDINFTMLVIDKDGDGKKDTLNINWSQDGIKIVVVKNNTTVESIFVGFEKELNVEYSAKTNGTHEINFLLLNESFGLMGEESTYAYLNYSYITLPIMNIKNITFYTTSSSAFSDTLHIKFDSSATFAGNATFIIILQPINSTNTTVKKFYFHVNSSTDKYEFSIPNLSFSWYNFTILVTYNLTHESIIYRNYISLNLTAPEMFKNVTSSVTDDGLLFHIELKNEINESWIKGEIRTPDEILLYEAIANVTNGSADILIPSSYIRLSNSSQLLLSNLMLWNLSGIIAATGKTYKSISFNPAAFLSNITNLSINNIIPEDINGNGYNDSLILNISFYSTVDVNATIGVTITNNTLLKMVYTNVSIKKGMNKVSMVIPNINAWNFTGNATISWIDISGYGVAPLGYGFYINSSRFEKISLPVNANYSLVDENSNGKWDYLKINVFTNATYIEAYLYANGTFVTYDTGKHIEFNGAMLYLYGYNGSYEIIINAYDNATGILNSMYLNTTFLNYTDFESPCVTARITNDYGVDIDENGKYNYLVINISINAKISGNYTIGASLFLENGTFVDSSQSSQFFLAGNSTITLRFYIGNTSTFLNSSLIVRYLFVNFSGNIVYFPSISYTTHSYSSTQFDKIGYMGNLSVIVEYKKVVLANSSNLIHLAVKNIYGYGVSGVKLNITTDLGKIANITEIGDGKYSFIFISPSNISQPQNITLTINVTHPYFGKERKIIHFFITSLIGDLNVDGRVNILDLIMVAQHFGNHQDEENYDATVDLNNDDEINVLDLIIVAMHWTG